MGHQLLLRYGVAELETYLRGEVSEWFKELVLKTSDSERGRGFESHPLRHDLELLNVGKGQMNTGRSTQEAEEDGLLNR